MPSIFSVIDRRRGQQLPPTVTGVETPPVAATPAHQPAPQPDRAATARPESSPRPRRPGSFSEAEAAFFAAGDEFERGDRDRPGDDWLDERAAIKRPTLWRRLTGRGGPAWTG